MLLYVLIAIEKYMREKYMFEVWYSGITLGSDPIDRRSIRLTSANLRVSLTGHKNKSEGKLGSEMFNMPVGTSLSYDLVEFFGIADDA